MKQIAIGIDLGTTSTVVCYPKNGRPTPIKFRGAGNVLPSIIYVDEDGGILVGNAPKSLYELDAENGVRSSKIFMGDASKKWICRGRKFTPTDVATEILKFTRQKVIQELQCDENANIDAVITVPAEFTAAQIDATKNAGEAAGFNVTQLITEPMAAAMAINARGKIMVVDFDDNKLALTLLEIDGDSCTMLAHIRNSNICSENFYTVLENYLLKKISRETGRDLASNSMLHGRLISEATRAIEDLRNSAEAYIYLPHLFLFEGEMYNFDLNLTREKFDGLCKDIYAEIFTQIDELIAHAKIFPQDLSEIIFVGDDYCASYVRDALERRFNRRLNLDLEPSTLVAYGACLLANQGNHELEENFGYDAQKNRILEKLTGTQKLLDNLCSEAEGKIRELDQRRIDLENEYRQKNAELERERETCRAKIAELDKKIAAQDSQLETLANTQELLDEMLAGAERQRGELETSGETENVELEKTRADLLQQYLDDANREIDALKAKLELSGGEMVSETENVELEKTRADLLQQYLDDANREIDALKAKLELSGGGEMVSETENVELEKTRADLLQQYLDDANREIDALKEQIELLRSEMG